MNANGWLLSFNYEEGANIVSLEIVGDAEALRSGFGFIPELLIEKLLRKFEGGQSPEGMAQDSTHFSSIRAGGRIEPYEGKYLRVEPRQTAGLSVSIGYRWE